jgi:hypothetical protein
MEYRQIELDYCLKCSGIWFDSGELDLLLKSANLKKADFLAQEGMANDAKPHEERKCPICSKKMKEIPLGEPAIHIDVCRAGDGIWFDGGELHDLLKQVAAKPLTDKDARKEILAFISEAFKAGETENPGA